MNDIHFQGFWRMDWGLGNPNKTAALIATLMVGIWFLAYARKWGFWAALLPFTALGVCLIHTFSRGGLISAFAGFGVLLIFAPRPWPASRMLAVGISVLCMVFASTYLQAHERYGQGVRQEDRSITNRLELWKAAPVMMAGAPAGWGWGKAGEAFMQWYQPLDHNEEYRTLVNSHLTWLVEFGWLWRFLYILGWLLVFAICWPSPRARWLAVSLAVWTVFAVASFFSSVAESPWLWIVPAFSFLLVLGQRVLQRNWPRNLVWPACAGSAALICGGLWLAGGAPAIRASGPAVVTGQGTPKTWIAADKKSLGRLYGKTLRRFSRGKKEGIAVVESVLSIPDSSGATLVIAGQRSAEELQLLAELASQAKKVILLSPGFHPMEFVLAKDQQSKLEVVFGEFSEAPSAAAWEETGRVRRIPGSGDFFPSWPDIVFSAGETSILQQG